VHFRAGLDEANLPPEWDAQFWEYVQRAALHMVNTVEPVGPST
jgi:hemoglobin